MHRPLDAADARDAALGTQGLVARGEAVSERSQWDAQAAKRGGRVESGDVR